MDPFIRHLRAEYEQLSRDLEEALEAGPGVVLSADELDTLALHAARLKALLVRLQDGEQTIH